MLKSIAFLLLALSLAPVPLAAQAVPASTIPASQPPTDPWKALAFLEGTWTAQASGAATLGGRYSFERELNGHVLARHSTTDAGCTAPASFDCKHGDLLYVFQDAPGQPLRAIYFDNEGHVLHYAVSTPSPTTAVFLSEPSPGPRFRLVYELKDDPKSPAQTPVLTGRFEMQPPGQSEWKTYLAWSGANRSGTNWSGTKQ